MQSWSFWPLVLVRGLSEAADALALFCPTSSPLSINSPWFPVFSPPGKMPRHRDHVHRPELSYIRGHIHMFLAHTFPPAVFSIISLPPPIFPVWSHCWQHGNLWSEARHGSTDPRGSLGLQNSHLLPGSRRYRWLAELSGKPMGRSDEQLEA